MFKIYCHQQEIKSNLTVHYWYWNIHTKLKPWRCILSCCYDRTVLVISNRLSHWFEVDTWKVISLFLVYLNQDSATNLIWWRWFVTVNKIWSKHIDTAQTKQSFKAKILKNNTSRSFFFFLTLIAAYLVHIAV